jgi:hypothetical protein
VTLKELEDSELIKRGEFKRLSEVLPGDSKKDYDSWVQKPRSRASRVVESLMSNSHSSGCAIALSSVVTALLYSTYPSSGVFDGAYDDITLSNAYFRKSRLLPKLSFDRSGLAKAKLGRNGLIGEPGYLRAILQDEVDQPDYAGENIIITEMSEAATQDLIKMGGLGDVGERSASRRNSANSDEDDEFDAEEEDEPKVSLSRFKGASRAMIELWRANKSRSRAKVNEILSRPFFSETRVWGHPSGELSLGEWLIELAGRNPRTPYAMMLYDYGMLSTQWENYRSANLGR